MAVTCLLTAPAALAATVTVGYGSKADLRSAVETAGGRVVRTIPSLRVAEIEGPAAASELADEIATQEGIDYVQRVTRRISAAEPALAPWAASSAPFVNAPFEWQYAATRANLVPASVLRAAGAITIAVVDTGADVSAPDIAAKTPATYNVLTGSHGIGDRNGHGTFVASLAAGSVTNGQGIAGFGGDAKLLAIQAGRADGSFTDVDEAAAIVYAVDHGAKIINLSLGGTSTSIVERRAVEYAAASGVLLVAAAGNGYQDGNLPEYPAALLQPVGSRGVGGVGLSVAASTPLGTRAAFSNTGSHISLAAPGEEVLAALSSASSASTYPRFSFPGAGRGLYGFGSGTSFSAPEVAGAAALVWAAAPTLSASAVAEILKRTASGRGGWNSALGWGVIDVASAVSTALGAHAPDSLPTLRSRAQLRVGVRRSRRGRVQVAVRLRARMPAISSAGRVVRLEVQRRGGWRVVRQTRTTASGDARFAVRVSGTVGLRVRYPGARDLAAAKSPAVRVAARGRLG